MQRAITLRDGIDSNLPIFFEHQSDPVANQMAASPPRTWDAFRARLPKTRPLHGVTAKHNLGSRRVLEKCGFNLIEQEENDVVLILE